MATHSRKHFIAGGDGEANYNKTVRGTAAAMGMEQDEVRRMIEAFQDVLAEEVCNGQVVPWPGIGKFRGLEADGEIHLVFEPEKGSPMRFYRSEPLRPRDRDSS